MTLFGNGRPVDGIADDDQVAVVVEGSGEVAAALELGRHVAQLQRAGVGPRQELLVPEEEQLVAAAVELPASTTGPPTL